MMQGGRPWSDLTQSDLDMTAAIGNVEERDGALRAHRPKNPSYHWGNFLLLPRAPRVDELEDEVARARAIFDDTPCTHVHLRWDGDPLDDDTAALAVKLGMTKDEGLELAAKDLVALEHEAAFEIRRLDTQRERARIASLNALCDSAEQGGAEAYCVFKRHLRDEWWDLCAAGRAAWWGVFEGDELIAQCGLVDCKDGLARFQSVETHPEQRRRRACSQLIAHVGRDALARGARTLLLGVDAEGPALGLYERLGFARGARQRSLILGASETRVRDALAGDMPELRSMTRAACRAHQEDEAAALAALDEAWTHPSGQLLVIDRGGGLLGCAALVPKPATQALTLRAFAIRPSQRGQGLEPILRAAVAAAEAR